MLGFTRVHHSASKDVNQSLGNFTHNFDKRINPPLDYAKEPLASARYDTAQESCESGWEDLAPRVYLGKLAQAQAVYDASKEICDIYENGEIKASMLIKDASKKALASNALRLLKNPDGTELLFFKDSVGIWGNVSHAPIEFKESAEGYSLTLANDTVESYDKSGKLTSITNAAQNLTLVYDDKGRLSTLTNSFNQSITLNYDANSSLLTELTSYDGTKVSYSYDENHHLVKVTYPDASTKTYEYNSDAKLTAIKDASGTVVKVLPTQRVKLQPQQMPMVPTRKASTMIRLTPL